MAGFDVRSPQDKTMMSNCISNTEARYNNALFFIKLYTADEQK